jgi:hypothetical protein
MRGPTGSSAGLVAIDLPMGEFNLAEVASGTTKGGAAPYR